MDGSSFNRALKDHFAVRNLPDRPAPSPMPSVEVEEFDSINDDCIKFVLSECPSEKLVAPISRLLEIEHFGLDMIPPYKVREALKDLHDAMKETYGENV